MVAPTPLTGKLIDALYVEMLLLADEARSYFDGLPPEDGHPSGHVATIALGVETVKVTARLRGVISWVLATRSAWADARELPSRLGPNPVSHDELLALLPDGARLLVEASDNLHRRAGRLEALLTGRGPAGDR